MGVFGRRGRKDLFYAQMTVRETLLFAARLRLPRGVPLGEKEAIVDRLLDKLNLAKVAWYKNK